jgi:hypothetical protein
VCVIVRVGAAEVAAHVLESGMNHWAAGWGVGPRRELGLVLVPVPESVSASVLAGEVSAWERKGVVAAEKQTLLEGTDERECSLE